MNKAKEKNSLYNFNADDEKNKKKNSKNSKNALNKSNKKGKTSKKAKEDIKKNNNKFDFSNEIVIGLTRIDDKKQVQNKAKNKKDNKNKDNNNIYNRKKSKEKQKQKEKLEKNKETKKKQKENDLTIEVNAKKRSKQKTKASTKNKVALNKKKESAKKQRLNKNLNEVNINLNEQDIILGPNTIKENTKKKKKFLNTLKYVFLGICVILAIVAAMMSPLFNIKLINVYGNEKITVDEIISLSQININENTYRTSMTKAKKKILENPYIEDVKIKRVLPDKVNIEITERKPSFMIEYGSGYVYINNQGYILEVADEKLDAPILQGEETLTEDFVPGKRLCLNDLNKLTTVIKIMEIAESNEISGLISRIDIANKQNYKIVFESENKVAYFGDSTDINTKILSIKSILEREKDVAGEIFVNMDLKTGYPTFRQSV